MQDRRKYIRFNIEGSVILKSEDGKCTIRADLVDINLTGIAVYAEEKLNADTNVSLELTSKLWEESTVGKGRVKYVQERKRNNNVIFRIGIEFIDIEKKAIQYIINRIQEDICAKARKAR